MTKLFNSNCHSHENWNLNTSRMQPIKSSHFIISISSNKSVILNMERGGCIYILSNVFNTVIYIGVTSNLFARVIEHKSKLYPKSFTAKYNCNKLVYFEMYSTIEEAIGMEKRLKKWDRAWKIELIEKNNPLWVDLYNEDL